jgi:hypothetical protein
MEETWFGRWRGILSGRRLDEIDRSRLHSYVERAQEMAVEILGRRIQNEQLLEVWKLSLDRGYANREIKISRIRVASFCLEICIDVCVFTLTYCTYSFAVDHSLLPQTENV